MENLKDEDTFYPFAKAVVFYRELKGLNRYQLAKKSRRMYSDIKRIEESCSSPRIETMLWMAEALDISVHELFAKMVDFMEQDKR